MERPDSATFAQYSYYLAIASSGIITLTFVFGLLQLRLLANIMWLALITAGIGLFLASAARSDFKRREQQVPEDLKRKSRVGFRINLGVLAVMMIAVVFQIVLALGGF